MMVFCQKKMVLKQLPGIPHKTPRFGDALNVTAWGKVLMQS